MTGCARTPGCPGTVDEFGFCDRCGLAAIAGGAATSARASSSRSWMLAPPRHCPECGEDVPPEADGDHPRPARFCGRCGIRHAWVPDLAPGTLVGEQYQVVRCLARGGLGWVYLAEDTHLDHDEVALKGVVDRSNAASVRAAVAERRFLTSLHHHNLVRIRDFAVHADPRSRAETGYIVMEYLDGPALSELQADARDPSRPDVTLTLDDILRFGHEILTALDYLHERGLLYTDMKPSNVIRTADRCKLIDIGSVVEAAKVAGAGPDEKIRFSHTPGYFVDLRPTVRSDLYAVGVTLRDLTDDRTRVADPAADGPAGEDVHRFGMEPLTRLIRRATSPDPLRRFGSAAEMAAQVTGILRDTLPDDARLRRPETSELFAPSAALLDDGLGAPPQLRAWTTRTEGFRPGQPDGPLVAAGLPVPRTAPDDANAALLDSIGPAEPADLLEKLADLTPSAEVELARCRSLLRLGRPDEADAAVVRADAGLAPGSPHRWRLAWHRGLAALAREEPLLAEARFDEVYADLPGECPPRLALAYCAERTGETKEASDLYLSVWRRDRVQASAAFGLARLRLAAGERDRAVAALDAVSLVSGHYDASRIAAVRILSATLGDALPTADHLNRAASRTAALRLDGGDPDGPARQRLIAALRQAALARVEKHGPDGLAGGAVFGSPPTERAIRLLLETSFRTLAGQAATAHEHGVLVDRANETRPWSSR